MKIKQLKCKKCKTKVANDDATIDLCINTCPNKDKGGDDACGMKHMNDFVKRFNEKRDGRPKQLPALLQKQPFELAHGARIEVSEPGYMRQDCGIGWLCQHGRCGPCQNEDVDPQATVEVTQTDFSVDIDEPIVIFVHKNGRIEHRSP